MHFAETASRPATAPRSTATAPLTYTLNDAVAASGLSRSTLYRHGKEGRLRLVKVGGRRLVDAASLRALVGSRLASNGAGAETAG
jgi:predicted DNA-binding transcriptional regulator AlpA